MEAKIRFLVLNLIVWPCLFFCIVWEVIYWFCYWWGLHKFVKFQTLRLLLTVANCEKSTHVFCSLCLLNSQQLYPWNYFVNVFRSIPENGKQAFLIHLCFFFSVGIKIKCKTSMCISDRFGCLLVSIRILGCPKGPSIGCCTVGKGRPGGSCIRFPGLFLPDYIWSH